MGDTAAFRLETWDRNELGARDAPSLCRRHLRSAAERSGLVGQVRGLCADGSIPDSGHRNDVQQ